MFPCLELIPLSASTPTFSPKMIKIFQDLVQENLIFSTPGNAPPSQPQHQNLVERPTLLHEPPPHPFKSILQLRLQPSAPLRVGLSVDIQQVLTEHITGKEVPCHTAGEGRGEDSFHCDLSLRGESPPLLQGDRSREGCLGGSFTIPGRVKQTRDRRVAPCGAQPGGI